MHKALEYLNFDNNSSYMYICLFLHFCLYCCVCCFVHVFCCGTLFCANVSESRLHRDWRRSAAAAAGRWGVILCCSIPTFTKPTLSFTMSVQRTVQAASRSVARVARVAAAAPRAAPKARRSAPTRHTLTMTRGGDNMTPHTLFYTTPPIVGVSMYLSVYVPHFLLRSYSFS